MFKTIKVFCCPHCGSLKVKKGYDQYECDDCDASGIIEAEQFYSEEEKQIIIHEPSAKIDQAQHALQHVVETLYAPLEQENMLAERPASWPVALLHHLNDHCQMLNSEESETFG